MRTYQPHHFEEKWKNIQNFYKQLKNSQLYYFLYEFREEGEKKYDK